MSFQNNNGFSRFLFWTKITILVILVILAICTILGGFYTVGEQEQAVVTMFGKVVRVDKAGLYFKMPWIQQVKIIDTTTSGMPIGYAIDKYNTSKTDESMMITKDFNIVNIDFYMEYRISDPISYLYSTAEPVKILKNMALACIRSVVVNYTVDEVITTAKNQIQIDVKAKLSEMLAENNIGLSVVNLSVQDAEPPTDNIQRAFKAVETAKQGKETAINMAKKYRSEQLPIAEAKADQIIQKAEAVKEARVSEAQGQVARFVKMFEEYQSFPEVTKKRLWYETMENVLPNVKVVITDGNTSNLMPIESFGSK